MFTTLRSLHGTHTRRGRADLAHDFVVKALPKPRFMAPTPYKYHCIRCGWSFIFNNPKGRITALDQAGAPLGEPANTVRSRTFASGPCPALADLAPSATMSKSNHYFPPVREELRGRYPRILRPLGCPPNRNEPSAQGSAKISS